MLDNRPHRGKAPLVHHGAALLFLLLVIDPNAFFFSNFLLGNSLLSLQLLPHFEQFALNMRLLSLQCNV